MKTCSKCKQVKELEEFPVKKTQKNGQITVRRTCHCKKCVNEYFRQYMKGNKQHIDRVKRGKRKSAIWIESVKKEIGCVICRYNKCIAALHFHHLNPSNKSYELSWAKNKQLCKSKLMIEMRKCIIVCANCHYEIEHKQLNIMHVHINHMNEVLDKIKLD